MVHGKTGALGGLATWHIAISHKVHMADVPELRKFLHLEEHLAHAGDIDASQDSLGQVVEEGPQPQQRCQDHCAGEEACQLCIPTSIH